MRFPCKCHSAHRGAGALCIALITAPQQWPLVWSATAAAAAAADCARSGSVRGGLSFELCNGGGGGGGRRFRLGAESSPKVGAGLGDMSIGFERNAAAASPNPKWFQNAGAPMHCVMDCADSHGFFDHWRFRLGLRLAPPARIGALRRAITLITCSRSDPLADGLAGGGRDELGRGAASDGSGGPRWLGLGKGPQKD